MAKLIREYMADVDGDKPIGGPFKTVEIDETLVGGYRRNGMGGKGRTVVFGMLNESGDVVTEMVPSRKSGTLPHHIVKNVRPYSQIHTDSYVVYGGLSTLNGYWQKQIDHSINKYVLANGATVNGNDNFWRHLKCAISGAHVSVSPRYLGSYAKKFEFRFNRPNRPKTMFPELISTFLPSPAQSE
ncbi:hypothetical protein MTsPCn7_10700 [Altererythrobacter sp. MTPC7]